MFKTVAGVLQFGNIEVKQRPREEWATIPTATVAEKVNSSNERLATILLFI